MAATLAAFGKIDVLVTSAGVNAPLNQVQDVSLAEWQRTMDINLTGTFLCCRAVLPGMIERNSGRIVTVASLAGKEPKPKLSAYAASKAGVIAFTKALGQELALTNIRANAFAPGAILYADDREPAAASAGDAVKTGAATALWHGGGMRGDDRLHGQ